MDRVAFRLGPLEVRWYGVLITVGIMLGALLAYREARRRGENPELVFDLLLVILPAAIIGARLYYVVFRWEYYSQHLIEIPQTWRGGLAIHGGVLGGVLAGYLFTRYKRLQFWKWADIVAPSIILGQAIGRWGNYINQEAYGYITDVPWAMYIAGAYRHPTFLYESLWNLGVFAFLLYWRQKGQRFQGEIAAFYALLYSLGRFWIEAFRTDSLMLGPFRVAQLVSLALIAVATVFIVRGRKAAKTC